ncbi:MAG: EamA family transporter RarD, partial [Mesorhizobium sp.]
MPTQAIQLEADSKARRGFLLALGAYLLWGLLPFYMK